MWAIINNITSLLWEINFWLLDPVVYSTVQCSNVKVLFGIAVVSSGKCKDDGYKTFMMLVNTGYY